MAELATIARPYAEALFQSAADPAAARQLKAVAAVAADPQLRQFAGNPNVGAGQVFELIAGVVGEPLSPALQNFLRTVIDNGRVGALTEIEAQYQALLDARTGVSQATVYSAFPMDAAALATVQVALEKRFARKLDARVVVQPELIGGIRVVVGDEVLDTSVQARLEQMKTALSAA